MHFYQGKFIPKNPQKYVGDSTKIFYRSSWEAKLMSWLDRTNDVISWSSEEIVIPYVSPKDNRTHRYFPDFLVRINTNTGLETYLIEIKPYRQTQEPKSQKRKTKKFLTEIVTYAVNKAKWKEANKYCEERGWKFKIFTENELGIK